jgi:ribonuclease HI
MLRLLTLARRTSQHRFTHTNSSAIASLNDLISQKNPKPTYVRNALRSAIAQGGEHIEEASNILASKYIAFLLKNKQDDELRYLQDVLMARPELLPRFAVPYYKAQEAIIKILLTKKTHKMATLRSKYLSVLGRMKSCEGASVLPHVDIKFFGKLMKICIGYDLSMVRFPNYTKFQALLFFQAAMDSAASGHVIFNPTGNTVMLLLEFYVYSGAFSAAVEFFKKIMPNYGGISLRSFKLLISGVGYSQEPIESLLPLVEDIINVQMPSHRINIDANFIMILKRVLYYTTVHDKAVQLVLKLQHEYNVFLLPEKRNAPLDREHIEIFTDASVGQKNSGYAVVMIDPKLVLETDSRFSSSSVSFHELYAIHRGLHHTHDFQKVIIRSDSRAAVNLVNDFRIEPRGRYYYRDLLQQIMMEIRRVKGFELKWVKAHALIRGNVMADEHAKKSRLR